MKQSYKEIIQKYDDLVKECNSKILSLFDNLECPNHQNRFLDQICVSQDCNNEQLLFCSNCNIQSDQVIKHVKDHKGSIIELEKYLPQKIQELIGLNLMNEIEANDKILTDLEKKVGEQCQKTVESIGEDCKKLQEYITILIKELQQRSEQSLKEYQEEQVRLINQQRESLKEYKVELNKEQLLILDDLLNSMSQLDKENNKNVNNFIKKIKHKQHSYFVQQKFDILKQQIRKTLFDLDHTPFYQKQYFNQVYSFIQNEFEHKIVNNLFLDLNNHNHNYQTDQTQQPLIFQNHSQSYQIHQSIHKVSISTSQLFKTQHKMPINSLCLYQNFLITNGNDFMVTFQYNNEINLQLYQHHKLILKDLCTKMNVLEKEDLLIIGLNNGVIQIYCLKQLQQQKVKLLKEFDFHSKQIKSIEFIDKKKFFISSGYDDSFYIWNTQIKLGKVVKEKFNSLNFNPRLSILDHDQLNIFYGNKSGEIQIVNILEENNLKQNKPQKVFSERISQLVMSKSQKNRIYLGNETGRILICEFNNVDKISVLESIQMSRSCIYGLVLLEQNESDQYLIQLQWDNQINIINLNNFKSVSSVFHSLKNDPKKHFNPQGTQLQLLNYQANQQNILFTSGNNDTNIQIFNIHFN